MVKGKGQFEGFSLHICYLLGLLNVTFEISEPLHTNKWLNATIVAYFIKKNSSSTAKPLKLRIEQNAHKKNKALVKAQAKKKMIFDSSTE